MSEIKPEEHVQELKKQIEEIFDMVYSEIRSTLGEKVLNKIKMYENKDNDEYRKVDCDYDKYLFDLSTALDFLSNRITSLKSLIEHNKTVIGSF